MEPGASLAETTALYRARAIDSEGKSRRFRLFLWTDGKDRLHAEVIAPVGGTVAILDGHPGRFSASFPRDREAYVGVPSPETFRRLVGVSVGLRTWIGTLTGGEAAPPGIDVEREGEAGRLPSGLILREASAEIRLELRRLSALPVGGPPLGLGEPPAGHRVHPLSSLAVDALPVPAGPADESPPGR